MKTELSLDVSNSTNTKIIRIYDTSNYCDEPVENYLIEILPVNKSTWIIFNVNKDFSLTLNSSNLRYKKTTDFSQLIDLPDGIYEIKQSIKPNIHTKIHFYYFRITFLLNKIKSQKNKLINGKCDISREEFITNRDKLRDVEEYVDAAKWSAEECSDREKAKELYEFAKKLLENYTHECKC